MGPLQRPGTRVWTRCKTVFPPYAPGTPGLDPL